MCPAERNHGWWSVRELKQDVTLSDKGHRNSHPSARHGIDYNNPVISDKNFYFPYAGLASFACLYSLT